MTETTAVGVRWPLAMRIGFRFGFCYFGLFGLACLVGLTPILLAGVGVHLPNSPSAGGGFAWR